MKKIAFDQNSIIIDSPINIKFASDFERAVYTNLFNDLQSRPEPHIDFDTFRDSSCGIDIVALAAADGLVLRSGVDAPQKAMIHFLESFPYFYAFIQNLSVSSDLTIRSAEEAYGKSADGKHFIEIKKVIDQLNSRRWTREKNTSERQSGVSVLGSVSEKLLLSALKSFVDNENFFVNSTSSVKSYGDFVLMCLPNNLWLSVKSNYARERLLASGFTTDIIGVGFFTDGSEFTSSAKLRNFQKVGFLAMYVPDIPITEDQVKNNRSTYSEIEQHYTHHVPVNINGMPFIRKLSALHKDLQQLIDVKDIRRRVTIGF